MTTPATDIKSEGGSKGDVSQVESGNADTKPELSQEHRDFLMKRHGTVDLDQLPSPSDADPYNWPAWKKSTNLALVAFHAMMSTFTAAAIIPAYPAIAADLHIPVSTAAYLTSLQIAILGGAPLFWRPVSSRFGRRPVFLLSLLCSFACNIGCAKTNTYGAMAGARALVAFFISPAAAIGSAVVQETFFRQERARYMGVWTLMVTLGVPISPFIFGFVAARVDYHWIYWVLAIINAVQFVLYLLLGPETRYTRRGTLTAPVSPRTAFREEYLQLRRIDPTPLTLTEFLRPLRFFAVPCVLIPAAAYAMVFLFGSVLITVEIPQLFAEKFAFGAQQLGLQFLGIIIGSVVGEQLGGPLSDAWMRRGGAHRAHEYRLWLSYGGYALTIVGIVVFLVQTQNLAAYNVTPIVGAAIAAAGNQIVTTVLITYAVDCYHAEAAGVGVFVTFVRQMWGFIGPFWFPSMFENVGVAASAGVCVALMVGVSVVPTLFLHWRGAHWR